MNWLDIVLLCLAGIGFLKGLFDGMIKQVVSLIALAVAIYFCAEVAVWVEGHLIRLDWFSAESVTIISYIFGFILILGIILLAGEIVHRVVGVTPLGVLNHLGGGALGLVIMLLFLSLGLNFLEVFEKKSALIAPEIKVESRFYAPIKEIVPTIYPHKLFYNE
ncbi:CvpA family protein [Massilibacteroides vaginae]|uniref:CvpA family protein n=1 Tax=Massilibacteroides vaginae TaxID=1673718 RepID=UPI000A1CE608|nr:CvpA family protein [Massilibacteroides vaginae]